MTDAQAGRGETLGAVPPPPGVRGAARSSWAPHAVVLAVVGATAVSVFVDSRVGAFLFAVLLVLVAVARSLDDGLGPQGVLVRSRRFDVGVLLALAVGITGLAATAAGL